MSQQANRRTNREIRRAVGPDAVQLIQGMTAGLEHHTAVLTAHTQANADYVAQRDIDRTNHSMLANDHSLLRQRIDRIERSFWSRLRWVLFG